MKGNYVRITDNMEIWNKETEQNNNKTKRNTKRKKKKTIEEDAKEQAKQNKDIQEEKTNR